MKNKYRILGDIVEITLDSRKYGKRVTFISLSKLDIADSFCGKWGVTRGGNNLYVQGTLGIKGDGRRVLLHRWINEEPVGKVVDHFDHDTLNNTDENLRIITQGGNMQNRLGAHKNSKSGLRGVYWREDKKKWRCEIKINRKKIHLGYFSDKMEAAKKVKEARAQYMEYSQEASGM